MTKTRYAELQPRLEARLRQLERERERRIDEARATSGAEVRMDIAVLAMEFEALCLVRDAIARRAAVVSGSWARDAEGERSAAGDEACAGSSTWFETVLAGIWTAFCTRPDRARE